MEEPEAFSVQVSNAVHVDESEEEEDDVLALWSPRRRRESASERLNFAGIFGRLWDKSAGGFPRRTRDHRCKSCAACKSYNTCTRQADLHPCAGCTANSTCWTRFACEKWNQAEQAYHYGKFFFQAYKHPNAFNRVDLLT